MWRPTMVSFDHKKKSNNDKQYSTISDHSLSLVEWASGHLHTRISHAHTSDVNRTVDGTHVESIKLGNGAVDLYFLSSQLLAYR